MDKKKKLLDAALKLFVEYGFHGTPTSTIAKAAGVANGTLFHYYPTKDELVLALYIDLKKRLNNYIAENTSTETTLKAVLKGQYLSTLYWALENKNEFKFMEQFSASPYLKLIASEAMEKHLKPLFALLKQGVKDGHIKALPIDFIFTMITSHTFGVHQYLIATKMSKAKQHQLISDTFELLWKMIS